VPTDDPEFNIEAGVLSGRARSHRLGRGRRQEGTG
jgi:hypothetical protein